VQATIQLPSAGHRVGPVRLVLRVVVEDVEVDVSLVV
jgi:hypothetical protein